MVKKETIKGLNVCVKTLISSIENPIDNLTLILSVGKIIDK